MVFRSRSHIWMHKGDVSSMRLRRLFVLDTAAE
jgi:hypothetical protein